MIAIAAASVGGAACLTVGSAGAAAGSPLATYGKQQVLPFSGLVEPYGVAVDGAGNVYTSDLHTRQVYKLTPDGFQTTVTQFTGLLHIPDPSRAAAIGLAADVRGNVFVADYAHASVYELAKGAANVTDLPLGGPHAPPGLAAMGPDGVAVDNRGHVFASYYKGQVWQLRLGDSAPTRLPFNVAVRGKTRPDPFYSVAANSAGDVVATGTNDAMIYELKPGAANASSVFGTNPANAPGYFPTAVAVDAAGDVFATSNADFTVKEHRADGTTATLPITYLAGPPSIPLPTPVSTGKLTGYGLAVDATGDVFVTALDHQHVIELPVC